MQDKTYPELLITSLRPLIDKLKADGPITGLLAYPKFVTRMLRRWSREDFDLTEELERKFGEDICNKAMSRLMAEAGLLETDGELCWGK